MYFNYYQNGRRLTDTSKTITSLTISLHTFTTTPPCSPVSTPTATVPSPSKIPSDRIKPKRKRRMKRMIEIKRCYVKIPKLNPGFRLSDTFMTITSLHPFTTTPPCSPVFTPTASVASPSEIPSDRIKPKRKRRMKHMIEIKRCYVKIPKLNPGWNFIGLLALSQVPREMLQFYPI